MREVQLFNAEWPVLRDLQAWSKCPRQGFLGVHNWIVILIMALITNGYLVKNVSVFVILTKLNQSVSCGFRPRY